MHNVNSSWWENVILQTSILHVLAWTCLARTKCFIMHVLQNVQGELCWKSCACSNLKKIRPLNEIPNGTLYMSNCSEVWRYLSFILNTECRSSSWATLSNISVFLLIQVTLGEQNSLIQTSSEDSTFNFWLKSKVFSDFSTRYLKCLFVVLTSTCVSFYLGE